MTPTDATTPEQPRTAALDALRREMYLPAHKHSKGTESCVGCDLLQRLNGKTIALQEAQARPAVAPRTAAGPFCGRCGHEPHDDRDDPRCAEITGTDRDMAGDIVEPIYCGCCDVDRLFTRAVIAEHRAQARPAVASEGLLHGALTLLRQWRDASLNEDLSRLADLTNETTDFIGDNAEAVIASDRAALASDAGRSVGALDDRQPACPCVDCQAHEPTGCSASPQQSTGPCLNHGDECVCYGTEVDGGLCEGCYVASK